MGGWTTEKTEKAAKECGLSVERWSTARTQAHGARTRGQRPAGSAAAERKIATWGSVEGQMGLFDGDEV
jgi:hypothetical protein